MGPSELRRRAQGCSLRSLDGLPTSAPPVDGVEKVSTGEPREREALDDRWLRRHGFELARDLVNGA